MRLPTSDDAGKAGPSPERADPTPARPSLVYDPVTVRRLHEAHAYRAALLGDLWRMRRGVNRQGVADRRRELVLTRDRIAMLVRSLAGSLQIRMDVQAAVTKPTLATATFSVTVAPARGGKAVAHVG